MYLLYSEELLNPSSSNWLNTLLGECVGQFPSEIHIAVERFSFDDIPEDRDDLDKVCSVFPPPPPPLLYSVLETKHNHVASVFLVDSRSIFVERESTRIILWTRAKKNSEAGQQWYQQCERWLAKQNQHPRYTSESVWFRHVFRPAAYDHYWFDFFEHLSLVCCSNNYLLCCGNCCPWLRPVGTDGTRSHRPAE